MKSYRIEKGNYVGSTDDRSDRWYIVSSSGPIRKSWPGFATRAEARTHLRELKSTMNGAHDNREGTMNVERTCEWA